MHGNEKVIQQLNAALSSELTAIVQYMTQSEMCQSWGYKRLGDLTKARAIEEMKHAEGLIERVIFLDGIPSVDVGLKPQPPRAFTHYAKRCAAGEGNDRLAGFTPHADLNSRVVNNPAESGSLVTRVAISSRNS